MRFKAKFAMLLSAVLLQSIVAVAHCLPEGQLSGAPQKIVSFHPVAVSSDEDCQEQFQAGVTTTPFNGDQTRPETQSPSVATVSTSSAFGRLADSINDLSTAQSSGASDNCLYSLHCTFRI